MKNTMPKIKQRNKRNQTLKKRNAKKIEENVTKSLNECLRNISIGDMLDEVNYSSDWQTVLDEYDSLESSDGSQYLRTPVGKYTI